MTTNKIKLGNILYTCTNFRNDPRKGACIYKVKVIKANFDKIIVEVISSKYTRGANNIPQEDKSIKGCIFDIEETWFCTHIKPWYKYKVAISYKKQFRVLDKINSDDVEIIDDEICEVTGDIIGYNTGEVLEYDSVHDNHIIVKTTNKKIHQKNPSKKLEKVCFFISNIL